MYDADDVERLWQMDLPPSDKRFLLSALVEETIRTFGSRVVLVGGSATEIYTMSNYATSDIDMVAGNFEAVAQAMAQLGFVKEGRVWGFPDSGFTLDFPDDMLDGSWEKIVHLQTEFGKLAVIGVEDILIDRICRMVYWGNDETNVSHDDSSFVKTDEVIFYIMASYREKIDWTYLKQRAMDCGIEHTLSHFLKNYRRIFGQVSDQNPKRANLENSEEAISYMKSWLSQKFEKPKKDATPRKIFGYYAQVILRRKEKWEKAYDEMLACALYKDGYPLATIQKVLAHSPRYLGLSRLEKSLKADVFCKELKLKCLKKKEKDAR